MKKSKVFYLVLSLFFTRFGWTSDLLYLRPPEDSRSNPPVLTFAPDGKLWMAWPSYQRGHFRMAVCSRSQEDWSLLSYPDPREVDQVQPQILIGADNNPALIYSSFDGQDWVVNLVAGNSKGWDLPMALGEGVNPTAAMAKESMWIAWDKDGKIFLKKGMDRDKSGPSRIIEPKDSVLSYSSPCIAAGPGGEVWLTWTAARRGYQSVLIQRIDGKDHHLLVVDDGSGINRHPRLSVDSLGRAWVVYESLKGRVENGYESWELAGRPVYQMDKAYGVENPSRVVRITDGGRWWKAETPQDPALGLIPAVLCSTGGPVWIVSRSFTGYTGPPNYFSPICESLDAGGWANHGNAWLTGQSYKACLPLAEDPEGRVWTAWAQHDRKKIGYQDTPSWTHMDGPDFIVVAPMPEKISGGSPRLIPTDRKAGAPPDLPVPHRFQTTYRGEKLQVFFGDLHQHSEISGCGRRNGSVGQNQYYTRFVRGLDFMCTIDHAEHQNDHTWRMTQLAAEMHNHAGEFVTFSGFEWTSEFDGGGNLYRGHYNAIFRDVGIGDYYFSASDPRYNTPIELWEALKASVGGAENVLTFSHHTSRRMAWLTWNYYDPDMAPLIEIAQARGSYEYEGCFIGLELANDCARVSGHYIQDGLKRGMRWGFVASGDHGGRQLAAVFAPSLDRENIFRALKNKRAYATSGERIFLDVRVNGRFMGEEFVLEQDSRKVEIKAAGTAPLVEIDVFRNGHSVRKWVTKDLDVELEWEDREPLFQHENYYYVRVIQADGGQAWSSPIWIIENGVQGDFQFQVGGDELRVVYSGQETDCAVLMHNGEKTGVKGRVFIDVPEGWVVREKRGITVDCPPGSWRHAVFHISAPPSAIPELCLPQVKARFIYKNARSLESPLFVVGSPSPLSREQKAVLIDARAVIPAESFPEFIKKIAILWQKEF